MRSLKRISKQVIINRYHKDVRAVFDRVNDAEIILDAVVNSLNRKYKNIVGVQVNPMARSLRTYYKGIGYQGIRIWYRTGQFSVEKRFSISNNIDITINSNGYKEVASCETIRAI